MSSYTKEIKRRGRTVTYLVKKDGEVIVHNEVEHSCLSHWHFMTSKLWSERDMELRLQIAQRSADKAIELDKKYCT